MNTAKGETNGYSTSLMFDYGIDRLTLNKSGISNSTVDRLYRQYFVTTTGFLQTIQEVLNEQADSQKLEKGVHS